MQPNVSTRIQLVRSDIARQQAAAIVNAARERSRHHHGGTLPAPHVIHTVRPIWNDGHRGEPGLLANCYRNYLRLAVEHALASVAFPGISTGIYACPKKEATVVARREVAQFLRENPWPQLVVFVAFDEAIRQLYEQAAEAT